MQPALSISLFGSLSVEFGQDASSRAAIPLGGRAGLLLAFLALARGRYFNRSELAEILWSDCAEAASAGSFNTTLWRLRKTVERPPLRAGDLIASDRRGALCLRGGEMVRLDVEDFERMIHGGLSKPLEHLSQEDIDGLRRGVRLYKADVLTDLVDDWALRVREKHRRSYLNALGRLMQLSTLGRDYGEGIRYAQAILDCDALREDVHRDLMRLYLLNGQRAQALRQFETCRNRLRQELAIQPMRETLALYQRICDSALGISGDPLPQEVFPTGATGATTAAAARAAGLEAADPPPCGAPPNAMALPAGRALIDAARQHLADADAQLRLSLRFFEDPPA